MSAEDCSDKDCGDSDCRAKQVAQEVITLMSQRGLNISDAGMVARDLGYSVLMQCPPERRQELHDWIVSGIGRAVEQ